MSRSTNLRSRATWTLGAIAFAGVVACGSAPEEATGSTSQDIIRPITCPAGYVYSCSDFGCSCEPGPLSGEANIVNTSMSGPYAVPTPLQGYGCTLGAENTATQEWIWACPVNTPIPWSQPVTTPPTHLRRTSDSAKTIGDIPLEVEILTPEAVSGSSSGSGTTGGGTKLYWNVETYIGNWIAVDYPATWMLVVLSPYADGIPNGGCTSGCPSHQCIPPNCTPQ